MAAFGQDLPRDLMWGTVGSGLTPGSPPDGWTREIPEPDPEKSENPFPARFALLRLNHGTYRHGRGTHGSGLTQGSRWCRWKSGNPDLDWARAGKPVFPFCPIVTQPGHLQTSAGYLRIGLDLRILTIPKKSGFPFLYWPEIRESGLKEISEKKNL